MPPKKVVKIMNQKGQKGNKVTLLVDEKVNKKGKAVIVQPKRGQPPTQAELRAKKKAEQEAQAAQDRMLFKAVPTKAELEAKRKAKEDKERAERGEPSTSSGDAYAHLKQEEEYRWTAEDFEPVEEDETRLEEQLNKELEELREKMASGKVKGTPVTPESFAKWKKQKKKEKEMEERKAKAKAVRTGALTGKMLYEMDETLFKDDEDAEEVYEREDEEEQARGEEGGEATTAPEQAEGDEEREQATVADVDGSLFAGEDIDVGDDDDDVE